MIHLEVIRQKNNSTFTNEAQVHFREVELAQLPLFVRAELVFLKLFLCFKASLDDMTFVNLHGPWLVLVLVIFAYLHRGIGGW